MERAPWERDTRGSVVSLRRDKDCGLEGFAVHRGSLDLNYRAGRVERTAFGWPANFVRPLSIQRKLCHGAVFSRWVTTFGQRSL